MEKFYTLVKKPKLKYYFCVSIYILLNVACFLLGFYVFKHVNLFGESNLKNKIIILFAIAVIEILILLLVIPLLKIKREFFAKICFRKNGIFINNKLFLEWDSVKSKGIISVAEKHSYSPVTFLFDFPLNFKYIFFSSRILSENDKKALNYSIKNGVLCMQYRHDVLSNIKCYMPDFDLEEQYYRN